MADYDCKHHAAECSSPLHSLVTRHWSRQRAAPRLHGQAPCASHRAGQDRAGQDSTFGRAGRGSTFGPPPATAAATLAAPRGRGRRLGGRSEGATQRLEGSGCEGGAGHVQCGRRSAAGQEAARHAAMTMIVLICPAPVHAPVPASPRNKRLHLDSAASCLLSPPAREQPRGPRAAIDQVCCSCCSRWLRPG
jgi:hypothetical protein